MGLNEERGSDAAVLYTSVVGTNTHSYGGVDLVLARAENSDWLPLAPGRTYTAQVTAVVEHGDAPLRPGVMVLSLGPQLVARTPKVRVRDLVGLSTATLPDLKGAKTGLGGGPTLVIGGQPVKTLSDLQGRHPRSAIGWNREFFFLVEVDGRQRSLSAGMTMPELANYFVKLGCQEAMNLDGGGSATLWVLGTVMNEPSEGRPRPAANALVLVQKAKTVAEKELLTQGQR
jgi:hypothetical protein